MAETEITTPRSEILVFGTGTIVDGNIANARKEAVSDAMVKGIEAYLTRRLGSKGTMNNFPRIIHDIFPRAREEVENFNILAEEQIDKSLRILVKVKVNENVIEEIFREVGLVLMEGPPIKILFLVHQAIYPGDKISYWWKEPEKLEDLTHTELSLYRAFQDRGFQPINRMTPVPERGYSAEMRELNLPDEMAVIWGRVFSADVVIHGECKIVEGENVSINLKAFDVEKGSIISQDSQVGSLEGITGIKDLFMQGIDRTINNLATRLGHEIIKNVGGRQADTQIFIITLKNLKSFKQLRDFESFLKRDMTGVGPIKQTRVKGNSVSISVEFTGNRDRFIDRLLRHENLPFQTDLGKSEAGEIILGIR
ncbi:MAG: hypothetical protein ABII26_01080 [Pseudomonadota bacterium]